jgi:hypothetical protein
VHKRIISAVKRDEFVTDKMSQIILRGHWCHIIVLKVHASIEDKTDDVKDSFYEELICVFDKFNFKKLNEVVGKEQYSAEVSKRFAVLEDLDAEMDINSAWEMIRESSKISAKLQWLYDPNKVNQDNLNNIKSELATNSKNMIIRNKSI